MRCLVLVVLLACWGGKASPPQEPVSNAAPVTQAPPPAPSAESLAQDAMRRMTELQDRMCACKDQPCAEGVNADFTKWAEDMSKRSIKPADITEEDAKRITDVAIKYQECYTKLSPNPAQP